MYYLIIVILSIMCHIFICSLSFIPCFLSIIIRHQFIFHYILSFFQSNSQSFHSKSCLSYKYFISYFSDFPRYPNQCLFFSFALQSCCSSLFPSLLWEEKFSFLFASRLSVSFPSRPVFSAFLFRE